ncbi:glutaredoxin family protein [Deinococcus yavapaiensis]|uniref:Glutaredoxin-like protein DUF836 n=1 Tax=Deinococcus yavapaiensis KR-236 TaxID=694435 RepID=A0A318S9C8_9DEIO|nr:glutaredoxin family protein [Deinococcus yavapaiensis]PYE53063.1 glutaredoxin-like protein DUF836 [Deinococcus yavapaiensis KR-236]
MVLTLYARDGCHLCEQAEDLLTRLSVAFERVGIEGNATLEAKYGWDVPVLTSGERVLVKGVFTRARVQAALES